MARVSFALGPYSLDWIQLAVKLRDENTGMAQESVNSAFFVLEVIMVSKNSSHFFQFHSSCVVAQNKSSSLWSSIRQSHSLRLSIPDCVSHLWLFSSWTFVHLGSKGSVAAAVVKAPDVMVAL